MRNYFDQNYKTRFSIQTMNKQKGYQWVVEEMQNEFEYPLKDCATFDEYFSMLCKYNQHFYYFIRIYEIDNTDLNIENNFLKIISNIARFSLKKSTMKSILKDNEYKNFSSLFILGIIGGFVEKKNFHGSYDYGLFIYNNWFELYNLDCISQKNKENIEYLLNIINIKESLKIKKIYNDNINKIQHSYDKKNLNAIKKYNNLFNNLKYKRLEFCTWQESFLLTMARIKLTISNIVPLFSNNHGKYPDYDKWNKELLKKLKNFFKHDNNAMLILNLIDYKINNAEITEKNQIIVLNQVFDIIKKESKPFKFDNIWFSVLIKYMNVNDSYIKKNLSNVFIELKRKKNIDIILFLKEKGFKIDSDMKTRINNYYIKRINSIEKIEVLYVLIQLLEDDYIKDNINIDILNNIRNVFLKLIRKSEQGIDAAHSFYCLMNFYISIKGKINENIINEYSFELLELWKNEYYEKSISSLQERIYKQEIKNDTITTFNQLFLFNPIISFRKNFSWDERRILNSMKSTSQFALTAITKENTIYIDEFFPFKKKLEVYSNDSFEKCLSEYIESTQIKYEEQLLNSNLSATQYMYPIFELNNHALSMFSSFLSDETYELMYNDIKESFLKYELLDYPKENVKVADATQLIPLLELLIRELGIRNNVLPFKEKQNQIHIMKDSSTVLQNIIKTKYRLNKNFNNLEVYLFLYNTLYNVNCLNLRNELIHARQFIETPKQIKYAFKILILAIFWANLELSLLSNQ